MDGFNNEEDERPQRNKGIMLGKFKEKCESNDFGPNISIWYKPEKPTRARPVANEAVYDKFPREALLLFSDLYRGKIINGDKAVYLPDGCNIKIYKEIFEWIKECIATGDLVDFPTYDEDAPDTLARYIQLILVGEAMQIPARDFSEKIIKRMRKLAKMQIEVDRRISWELLEDVYADEDAEVVQKIAAATVFYSWWNGKIDSEDTPLDMEILAELREDYPQLDQDLKEEFEDQKRFLDERRKKRDEERAGTTGGGGGWGDSGDTATGGGGGWGGDTNTAAAGGWDDAGNTGAAAGGWDDSGGGGDGAAAATGDWNDAPATGDGGGGDAWDQGGAESTKVNTPEKEVDAAQFKEDTFGNDDNQGGDWADEVNVAAQW